MSTTNHLVQPTPNSSLPGLAASSSNAAEDSTSATLYQNKVIEDVVNQDVQIQQTQPQLTDSINGILHEQIKRGPGTEHSSQVLTKLIDCLCQSVVGQMTAANTSVEQRHASHLANTNAARIFTHSLCHILDDSLVWMDASQVSSTACSTFNTSRFQQSVLQNCSQVQRNVHGDYLFSEYWNACTEEQRQRFVCSAIQAYGQACTSPSCANLVNQAITDFCENGNANLVSSICDQIGAQLCNTGGGQNNACSAETITNVLQNCFSSCFNSSTSGQVHTVMTPSFITNWCVYSKQFKCTLEGNSTEGDCPCEQQLGGCGSLPPPTSGSSNGTTSTSTSSCYPSAAQLSSNWNAFCNNRST